MSRTPDKSKTANRGSAQTTGPRFPRSYNPARRVGSFVPKLTKKAFEKYGFSAASMLTDWPNIVGNELAQYTVPERLKWPRRVEAYSDLEDGAEGRPGATLMLRVDPARALDVQYETAQLTDRINAYFGYAAISQIRILQAPVAPPEKARTHRAPAANTNNPPLADLSQIEDEGLRDALARMEAGIKADRDVD